MKSLLFLAIFCITLSCTTLLKSSWPASLPNDLTITYKREGGYAPRFEKCIITKEKCSYTYEFGKDKYAFDFVLPEREIQLLYNVLRRNNFEQIEEDDKKIYDHIYEIIEVEINNKKIVKTDKVGIRMASALQWQNSLQSITRIIAREKEKRNIITH